MNRNYRTSILVVATMMILGTAVICFAANNPTATAGPHPVKAVKATTGISGKTPKKVHKQAALKVSKAKACKIALKAHPGATIADIKVDGKAYMIQLTSEAGNYTMRIGGNTGRIIRNMAIVTKPATTGAITETSKTPAPTGTK